MHQPLRLTTIGIFVCNNVEHKNLNYVEVEWSRTTALWTVLFM